MPFNRDDYNLPAWFGLKEYVIARDGGICCYCGRVGVNVAHHLTYEYGVLCAHEFLVALCERCHRYVHGQGAAAWRGIADDARARYRVRPSSERRFLFVRPPKEEQSAWERYCRWGTDRASVTTSNAVEIATKSNG